MAPFGWFPVTATLIVGFSGQCWGQFVYCYVNYLSASREPPGKFSASDIQPFLCTHIVYAYLGIGDNWNGPVSINQLDDINGKGMISELVNLKRQNPDLKVLVSIGGPDEKGRMAFPPLITDPYRRNIFIGSTLKYLRDKNLDGLEVAWHVPEEAVLTSRMMSSFTLFIRELRTTLKLEDKILIWQIRPEGLHKGFDVALVSMEVDLVVLQANHYHGIWERRTGISNPLRSQDRFDVETSTIFIIYKGIPREKLLLGLAPQGTGPFRIDSRPGSFLGRSITAVLSPPWSNEYGLIGYNEICWGLKEDPSWVVYWDEISMTPFAVSGNKFVSFDNERSILEKVKWASDIGLAGVSIWSLDSDDFSGLCSSQKYPLTTIAAKIFKPEILHHYSEGIVAQNYQIIFNQVVSHDY